MHGVVEALNRWGPEWTALATAMVWQSTLLAVVVACAALALRRSSPAARYWLWQIVAVKLLVVPFWTWSLAVPWSFGETETPASVAAAVDSLVVSAADMPARAPLPRRTIVAPPPSLLADVTWRGWLLAGWATIVLVQVGRLGVQRVRLSLFLRKTTPGDSRLAAAVEAVAARSGLRRPPRVVTTDLDGSPFVCGIARPTLVMPRELAGTLSAAELEQVVAHELAHVKRRDLVWGWIPEIARLLYFFHPVAHLASYRIRLERELACDQLAMIDSGRGPAEYADTLVRVLSSASRPEIFRTSAAAPLDGGASQTVKDQVQR